MCVKKIQVSVDIGVCILGLKKKKIYIGLLLSVVSLIFLKNILLVWCYIKFQKKLH